MIFGLYKTIATVLNKLPTHCMPFSLILGCTRCIHISINRLISRMHEAPEIDVRMRQRDWRTSDERRGLPTRRETQSQYVKHNYS